MASKVCELVEKLVLPFAEQCGVELVEVEYAKKVNGMNLTIFIDKEGGVCLNDCEKLHRLIDEPLDVLDPTEGRAYTLNVSSLGIDRPLKTERDFKRNLDKEIVVKLFAQLNGKKVYEGFLKEYDEKIPSDLKDTLNKKLEELKTIKDNKEYDKIDNAINAFNE